MNLQRHGPGALRSSLLTLGSDMQLQLVQTLQQWRAQLRTTLSTTSALSVYGPLKCQIDILFLNTETSNCNIAQKRQRT